MRTTNFPTHSEMLDVFAAGMREHKAKQEAHITVSPYLTRELFPMTPGVRLQIASYRIFRERFQLETMARINAERGGIS